MYLGLETSSDCASVALGQPDSGAIVERSVVGARRHASALLPLVAEVLAEVGVGLGDLDGVVVGDGPGSFTGLRVGAATAKALWHSRGIPVLTAPALMSLALGLRSPTEPEAPVLAVADALRGEVYAALYRFPDGAVETLRPPRAWRVEDLTAEPAPDRIRIGGSAPAPIAERLGAWAGGTMVTPPAGAPSAAGLVRLVGRRGGALAVADPSGWEPEYGRPAEAQAQWERRHGRPLPDTPGAAG